MRAAAPSGSFAGMPGRRVVERARLAPAPEDEVDLRLSPARGRRSTPCSPAPARRRPAGRRATQQTGGGCSAGLPMLLRVRHVERRGAGSCWPPPAASPRSEPTAAAAAADECCTHLHLRSLSLLTVKVVDAGADVSKPCVDARVDRVLADRWRRNGDAPRRARRVEPRRHRVRERRVVDRDLQRTGSRSPRRTARRRTTCRTGR